MKKILLTALLATFLQANAQDQINYNYLDLGYDYLDTDISDADGFNIEGSFVTTAQTYMGLFYKGLDGDFVDVDRYGLFGGYRRGVSDNMDFFVQLELGQIDYRFGDEFTYGLGIGTRTALAENFEINTKLSYTEAENNFDGFFEVKVQGVFKITEPFGITVDVKSLDGDFGAGLGARFSF